FSPYKAAWKYIAGKISGKAVLSAAVIEPVDDKHLGKRVVIPDSKIIFVPCQDSAEAHFVTGFLNSSIARYIVSGYAVETAISTHILKYVRIPRFDPKNPNHLEISRQSEKAHYLLKSNSEDELRKLEDDLDKSAAQLHGMSQADLQEIKDSLDI